MVLKALDFEGGQEKVLDDDLETHSDRVAPIYKPLSDDHQTESDWQDMEFADEEDDDEGDTLWPEDGPTLDMIDEDDDEDNQNSTFMDLEDLAIYPIVLTAEQKRCAQVLMQCCIDKGSSEQRLSAYHSVVLSIFTTNLDSSQSGPLHSLIEGFVMSTSIDEQGHFLPPHLISPHLAKILYAALFSILTEVMKFPDPYL